MIVKNKTVAYGLLLMVSFIWGIAFVVVDDAIKVMPANTFNAFRFALAAISLLPFLYLSKNRKLDENTYELSNILKAGIGLGLFLFLGFFFQTKGLLYTTVSNTGFITSMSVPLVPMAGLLLFRKKVSTAVWVGITITTIGLYFLTIGDKMEFNTGDILVAISTIFLALHITVMDKVSSQFPAIKLSIIQLSTVAFISFLAACVEDVMNVNSGYPPLIEQLSNLRVWAAIAFSALFASAFAYWAQTASQRLIEPHKIALIFALEPIFAGAAAYFILDEYLGGAGWFGATLIVVGMLYSELGDRKKVKIHPLDQIATIEDK